MVSPVSSRPPPHFFDQPLRTAPAGPAPASAGHLAKAAIAQSERTDLPRNIQGQIASRIAQGLDYAAILAAPPPPAPVDPAPPSDTAVEQVPTLPEDISTATAEPSAG